MRAVYDKKADALYVRFAETKIVESEEVRPDLVVDFDADGRIVSIEMLNARRQIAPEALDHIAAA